MHVVDNLSPWHIDNLIINTLKANDLPASVMNTRIWDMSVLDALPLPSIFHKKKPISDTGALCSAKRSIIDMMIRL